MLFPAQLLEEGRELCDLGLYEQAQACFIQVWQCPYPYATPQQKLLALKGYCALLDCLGRWIESETEFKNGFRHLTTPFQAALPGGMFLPPVFSPGAFVAVPGVGFKPPLAQTFGLVVSPSFSPGAFVAVPGAPVFPTVSMPPANTANLGFTPFPVSSSTPISNAPDDRFRWN